MLLPLKKYVLDQDPDPYWKQTWIEIRIAKKILYPDPKKTYPDPQHW